ncbi:unnamed protein product [Calicophoron daubneyi]|uniref:Uncharacterized protein n=1 Tax=Calicophoron daubneyi TaxID=300641 RepID=A0AAV2TU12_CALDB
MLKKLLRNEEENSTEGTDLDARCFSIQLNEARGKNEGSAADQLKIFDYLIRTFEMVETGRAGAEDRLEKSRKEFSNILRQLDRMAKFCVLQFPIVVEREHESAAAELLNLRWSIQRTQDELAKTSARVKALESVKHKLEEEIDRLTGCTLLVSEKSTIEQKEMERIAAEASVATNELVQATNKLHEAQIRCTLAERRAKQVRLDLKQDLATAKGLLKNMRLKFLQAVELGPRLATDTKAMREAIARGKFKTKELLEKHEICSKKILEKKAVATQLEEEQGNKRKEAEEMQQWLTINQTKLETRFGGQLDEEENAARSRKMTALDEFHKVHLTESELEAMVLTYEKRIQECNKNAEKAEADLKSLTSRLDEATASLNQANADWNRTSAHHTRTKNALDQIKREYEGMLTNLRKQIAGTEQRIQEESRTRASVLEEMKKEIAELEETKREAIENRRQLELMLAESEEAVAVEQTKVNKLKVDFTQAAEITKKLEDEFSGLEASWNAERSRLMEDLSELSTATAQANENLKNLSRKLAEIKANMETCKVEQKTLKKNILAMLKVKLRTESTARQLRCSQAEIQYTKRNLESQLCSLNKQIREAREQQASWLSEHSLLSKSRNAVMNELKIELVEVLKNNFTLAKNYKTNQQQEAQLIGSFYSAVSQLNFAQLEMCDAEQLSALAARVQRHVMVGEQRHRAACELMVYQLRARYDVVSCRIQVICQKNEGFLKKTNEL